MAMKRYASVDDDIAGAEQFQDELAKLRKIMRSTTMEEVVKWGAPCYTINGKNVVGIGSYKSYVGLWFHQGSFLTDPLKVLINAQEGKTKGMRSIKITKVNEVSEEILKDYITEAIENQKAGKEIKVEKGKVIETPKLLIDELMKKKMLPHFKNFSQSKQNEFNEYICSAKREETKNKRIEKIIPMIENGIGLNDKYRK